MSETNSNSLDIGRLQIGKVYATALLRSFDGRVDSVLEEFEVLVEEVFDRVPKFETTLASPRVSISEKLKILVNSLRGKASHDLLQFLKVVCQHERLDCLREILAEARRMRNEQRGILEFEMVTAHPVEDQLARSVAQQLKEKFKAEIELQMSVDPTLLGGVLIRTKDKVYDASLARKLEMIREDAIDKTVQQLRERATAFAAE